MTLSVNPMHERCTSEDNKNNLLSYIRLIKIYEI